MCRMSILVDSAMSRVRRQGPGRDAMEQPTDSTAARQVLIGGLCVATETGVHRRVPVSRCAIEETKHRHRLLLRARRHRPRDRRAAEQCDELPPLHSITSSARASSVGRDVDPKRLCGLEVDDQVEFRGLNDRQVGRLLALENPAGVDASLTVRTVIAAP